MLFVFALDTVNCTLILLIPPHKPTPEFLDGPQSPNSWAFDVRLGRACLYVETVQIQLNFVDGFGGIAGINFGGVWVWRGGSPMTLSPACLFGKVSLKRLLGSV